MHPDENANFFRDGFVRRRAMAILRGLPEAETRTLALSAWSAGLALVEVPLQGPQSADALACVVAEAAAGGHIAGAGTIVSVALAEQAAELGARFTVAPGFDPEVAARSMALGMPHLPGVATATEVQVALSHGYTWLKAFPAGALGPSWVAGMLGPFPGASFVATGGIDGRNAEEFLAAGAAAVSFGASFAKLNADDLARLA